MGIPDYETIMLPLLNRLEAGDVVSLKELRLFVADHFQLTPEERKERLPSGKSTYLSSRVHWAKTYLKMAGLLVDPKRAHCQITERGKEVLSDNPERIDNEYLKRFPEFVEFKHKSNKKSESKKSVDGADSVEGGESEQTPEEAIESAYQELSHQLANEILEQVLNCSPEFFEQLVIDLVVAMGYGGTFQDAARATKRSNDGGIDGVIKEDRLGLDTIYLQAKKWTPGNTVSRPEIQKFKGALDDYSARKGIFITTSSFTASAIEAAEKSSSSVVLIDGEKLTEYMVEYGIGVSTKKTYELKSLDSDYFEDGE